MAVQFRGEWLQQSHGAEAGEIASRWFEPSLIGVPVVADSRLHGLGFMRLGLVVDGTVQLSDPELEALVADGLYQAFLVQIAAQETGSFQLSELDLEKLRAAILQTVNEMTAQKAVRDVLVLQLDYRPSGTLRAKPSRTASAS